jgi:hypothetical protein
MFLQRAKRSWLTVLKTVTYDLLTAATNFLAPTMIQFLRESSGFRLAGSDAAKTAQVVGSNPTGPTKNLEAVKILLALFFGLLAFNEPCLRLVGVCFRAPCLQRTLFAAG